MRKITVYVKPQAKYQKIQPLLDGSIKVWVKSKPKQGKANQELVELLAKHFNVSYSCIQIIRGIKARKKIIVVKEC